MICSTHAVGLRCMIFSIKMERDTPTATINRVLGESRAMICPVNLFMNSQIDEEGTIKVKPPLSKAGDKIVFRAEIDVRVGIAACSVAESPCNSGVCTSIQVIVDRE